MAIRPLIIEGNGGQSSILFFSGEGRSWPAADGDIDPSLIDEFSMRAWDSLAYMACSRIHNLGIASFSSMSRNKNQSECNAVPRMYFSAHGGRKGWANVVEEAKKSVKMLGGTFDDDIDISHVPYDKRDAVIKGITKGISDSIMLRKSIEALVPEVPKRKPASKNL